MSDPDAKVVVVERRDRLAHFGVQHLKAAWSARRGRILVADPAENADDLVGDSTDVLTSMRARLHRRCGERSRAVRVLTATTPGPGVAP
jgi:putative resolvase